MDSINAADFRNKNKFITEMNWFWFHEAAINYQTNFSNSVRKSRRHGANDDWMNNEVRMKWNPKKERQNESEWNEVWMIPGRLNDLSECE